VDDRDLSTDGATLEIAHPDGNSRFVQEITTCLPGG
jgi:hypothetical protein